VSELATRVGDVDLRTCVLTAAGTAGYADELAPYGDLATLGAVVVKSLARFAWDGNPSPRVGTAEDAMINSVGLAGPGVGPWRTTGLPALRARGATVVASIWGRTVAEFADAAADLRGADVVAVEINASCPNLDDRASVFAHSAARVVELLDATADVGVPRWVKLSPNTPELVAIAVAAVAAGADALVLTNTLTGLVIDVETGRATLGAGGGGLSGPPLLPVALRAVFECRAALPSVPIVGVGGVTSADAAVQMVMAGADAVEVGSATFADPRAPWHIQRDLERWLRAHAVASVMNLKGRAHG
jgi:dihydroorotate dehydrogenase (NAD+) catalytic subunit